MQHGGRRPGAGRPRKSNPVVIAPADGGKFADAVSFLLEVMNNPEVKLADRIAIGLKLLPYLHARVPEGKKAQAELAAMSGRFAVRDAPTAGPDWSELLGRN